MNTTPIRVFSLLAAFSLAIPAARAQDFNQRFAAWQGRAPAPTRMVSQATPSPEVGGEVEAMPAPRTNGGGQSQRILGDVYGAPMHTPDYNNAWTNNGCATCGHNPTFEPASDPYGSCQFGGGQSWFGGGGGCGSCGGCGPCGQCGGAGGGCDYSPWCANPMVWARAEVLMWWRQGRSYPPIVTTDPTTESSTTAGILPDAQTLFGGNRVGSNLQAGGRLDLGFYTDPQQNIGFGDRFFGLGKDSTNTTFTSNNNPVLAIPFRDFTTGANDALLVAYPGLRTGSINIASGSTVLGNDVYTRILLCRDCNNRIDFITGWNYTRVDDGIAISSRQTVTETGGTIRTGTVTTITDRFDARNNFNGGILGLQWQRTCGVWTSQVLLRSSIGNMHEVLLINGSTTVAPPTGSATTTSGGLFTAASNIGRHARNEFTAIQEIGLNLGYRFSPYTQLNLGYSFLYWNDLLSPSNSIDTNVGTANGVTHPLATFRHSDFWVQGINLGLTREF